MYLSIYHYSDPNINMKRKGTSDDPYVLLEENHIVCGNKT